MNHPVPPRRLVVREAERGSQTRMPSAWGGGKGRSASFSLVTGLYLYRLMELPHLASVRRQTMPLWVPTTVVCTVAAVGQAPLDAAAPRGYVDDSGGLDGDD